MNMNHRTLICFLLACAAVLFLASCEGGAPTSLGACAGANFTAPDPTQPTGTLPISPRNPSFSWAAAVPDTGFEVKHYVVKIYQGLACSGSTIDTSSELTATSYQLTGNLSPQSQFAWEVEATFEETAGTTECEITSDCATFTTSFQ